MHQGKYARWNQINRIKYGGQDHDKYRIKNGEWTEYEVVLAKDMIAGTV